VMCLSRVDVKSTLQVDASMINNDVPSSTASGWVSKNPPREMDSIRAKYLHSLNISAPTAKTPKMSTAPVHHAFEKVHIEPLKKDFGEIDEDLKSVTSSSSSPSLILSRSSSSLSFSTSSEVSERNEHPGSSTERRNRAVSFDAAVTVKHVPMRTEYSNRVKCHLWTDPQELRENAQRNAVEFAFERYDWRLVTTEDEMYTDALTGTKIHPVHVARYFQAKQQTIRGTTSSRKDHFLKMSRKAAQRWSNHM